MSRPIFRPMAIATSLMLGCAEVPYEAGSTEPEEFASHVSQALAAPRDTIDCAFNNNRRCKSKGPIRNNAWVRTKWDPCYGGEFSWTAEVDFEEGFDYLCVDAVAKDGSCTKNGKITGKKTF